MASTSEPAMPENPWFKRPLPIALVVIGLVAASWIGYTYFAPRGTTMLAEGIDESDPMLVALKSGEWRDADSFHYARGTISIYEDADGHFLRFEGFDGRSGPDVYLYLSQTDDGSWDPDRQIKVLMPGGADDGKATLRGDFNIRLPADFDPDAYRSAFLWCDAFSELFGTAALAAS